MIRPVAARRAFPPIPTAVATATGIPRGTQPAPTLRPTRANHPRVRHRPPSARGPRPAPRAPKRQRLSAEGSRALRLRRPFEPYKARMAATEGTGVLYHAANVDRPSASYSLASRKSFGDCVEADDSTFGLLACAKPTDTVDPGDAAGHGSRAGCVEGKSMAIEAPFSRQAAPTGGPLVLQ